MYSGIFFKDTLSCENNKHKLWEQNINTRSELVLKKAQTTIQISNFFINLAHSLDKTKHSDEVEIQINKENNFQI